MAGAPGFEPGIAGPKPAALPLGYAPPPSSIGTPVTGYLAAIQTAVAAKPARPPGGIASDAAALGYAPSAASILFRALVVLALGEEVDERDDGDDRDRDDGGRLRQEPHDRDEHARRLRGREDP